MAVMVQIKPGNRGARNGERIDMGTGMNGIYIFIWPVPLDTPPFEGKAIPFMFIGGMANGIIIP